MTDALTSCWAMLVLAWKHSRLKLCLAVVLTLASGFAWPVVALALRAATSAAVAHDVGKATLAGVLTGIGAIGVLVLRHFAFVSYVEITEVAAITIEAEIMALVSGSASLEHHERPEFADKVAVLRQEFSNLMAGMGGLLTTMALTVSLGTSGVLLALINPWLLLLPVLAVPSVLAGHRATAIIERGRDAAATDTRQSWHLFDLVTDPSRAKELRVLRLAAELLDRHRDLWRRAGRIERGAELRATITAAGGQLCFSLAYVVTVLIVLRQAVTGRSSAGDVILAVTLAAQVNQQVSSGVQELRNLQRTAYGFTRLRWLRGFIAERTPPPPSAPVPDRIRTGIEFRDVSFGYPGSGRPVADHVDLLLPAGSTVAIVGENGAGKTTLVKLLCRFYPVTGGTVSLDGIDIATFPWTTGAGASPPASRTSSDSNSPPGRPSASVTCRTSTTKRRSAVRSSAPRPARSSRPSPTTSPPRSAGATPTVRSSRAGSGRSSPSAGP